MESEFKIGSVLVKSAAKPSAFIGRATRGGAEESGTAHTAVIATPDGFEGTMAVIEWPSGKVDVRLVDFAKGADAYRRLERAGTMSVDIVDGQWFGLLRALKYGDREYPTLHQVTWADLDALVGESAHSLLMAHGAVGAAPAIELKPEAHSRNANTLAFLADQGGLETVATVYVLTRVLPIMHNFGLKLPEAII